MVAIQSKTRAEEKKPIEHLNNGNILFRIPRLIRHMTEPDRVTILKWHIKAGDIVSTDSLLVHCEFLEDDWYITMPEVDSGPLRVLKMEAAEGQIVHLHDPLILWEPAQFITEQKSPTKFGESFNKPS